MLPNPEEAAVPGCLAAAPTRPQRYPRSPSVCNDGWQRTPTAEGSTRRGSFP